MTHDEFHEALDRLKSKYQKPVGTFESYEDTASKGAMLFVSFVLATLGFPFWLIGKIAIYFDDKKTA